MSSILNSKILTVESINIENNTTQNVDITKLVLTTTNESIDRIDKLITATFESYNDGKKTVTIRQLLQLAALFDTLHDFGKYSTCYDTLSGGRGGVDIQQYKILRMRFSALSKLVFGIGSDRLSRGYGSLRTPAQVYTSALTSKTLEADFLEFARQYRTTANTGTFTKTISILGDNYGDVMKKLRENGYGLDGTSGPVCLLVDTQKMLYKWPSFSDNCIVAILRESIYDAAGKLLISDDTGKNVHVETDRLVGNDSIDTYTYSRTDDSNDFVGNIRVSLGRIQAVDDYKLNAMIGDTDIPVKGNSGAKHPNSILTLNKNIDGAANANCGTTVERLIDPTNTTNENKPYIRYVESTKNTSDGTGCPSFANNNANFTQKRTGDGNQACICKRINTGKVRIRATNINRGTIDITKIVLVTIDRMLYAIALLLNIPVIYEHPTEGTAYIPNADTNFIMGGGNNDMTDDINLSNIYQLGGSDLKLEYNGIFSQSSSGMSTRTTQTYDDDINMAKYILENPVYMLALAPFIHKGVYDNSQSNFKTAIELILAMNYTTFINSTPRYITSGPAYTTYLRNLITTTTGMDDLIGPESTAYDADNTDIKIISLSSKNNDYTLIYKYGSAVGVNRNLYIVKNSDGSTIAPDSTFDTFGPNRIRDLFNGGISSEKIEEMIGELLAAKLEDGGYSLKGKIFYWSTKALAFGAVGGVIFTGAYKFFKSDDSINQSDIMEGGKLSSLSDKSEYSSSLDNSIINSLGEDTPPDNSLTDDDSKKKSSENGSEQSPEQSLNVDAIDDSSSSMTSMSDSVESESEIIPEKFPLLTQNNNYYAVAFNYTQTHKIIREHGINLPFYDDLSNVFTMFSYLWLFNKYVVNVCIDDEETAIAYDEVSVKGDERTVLIPTHKSLYLLFNKMVDIIKKEGTLPFLLTDLEQVLFDEKDYMYFQLQQIKRYVLQDDFIDVIKEKVDEPSVDKEKVDEPSVDKEKVDEPSLDEPSVDKEKVDEPSVDKEKVDEPSVDKEKVGKPSVDKEKVGSKEIILEFIKEANAGEQSVNTELSRLSETENFDDLLKYAIDRNLTRYGIFYTYTDYLTYISTLSIKKSTSIDTSESSSVDKSNDSIVSQESEQSEEKESEQQESEQSEQQEQKPSYGGIQKKRSSKINRKAKLHRVTKNKRKVSESRKSKKKQHSKRKQLSKKKRITRKNKTRK
jgi:hypothetical protein